VFPNRFFQSQNCENFNPSSVHYAKKNPGWFITRDLKLSVRFETAIPATEILKFY